MNDDTGRIEVVCGCMFSGKTEELIRRVKRELIAKRGVLVFKPMIDDRYGDETVTSHNGQKVKAITVVSAHQIMTHINGDIKTVAVDEAQFFDQAIVEVSEELADNDMRMILAGLDNNFRGEPFGPMPLLVCRAEMVTKLHAICVICSKEACRTQRIIDGQPADYSSPTILIGAQDSYEARCRKCHQVPRD